MLSILLFAAAQATPAAAPAAPPPAPPAVNCSDADHTAFDFWIGDWDVYAKTGTLIAHSKVEKIVNCAISETYDQFMNRMGQKADYHGRSISSYVPTDKGWQQYYVDTGGTAATLKGAASGGSMVFMGKDEESATTRMTLTPNADGSGRQFGERSTDDGKTWQLTFDFTYKKRTAAAAK